MKDALFRLWKEQQHEIRISEFQLDGAILCAFLSAVRQSKRWHELHILTFWAVCAIQESSIQRAFLWNWKLHFFPEMELIFCKICSGYTTVHVRGYLDNSYKCQSKCFLKTHLKNWSEICTSLRTADHVTSQGMLPAFLHIQEFMDVDYWLELIWPIGDNAIRLTQPAELILLSWTPDCAWL